MQFADRTHTAFVNLDPGEAMHFRLPPTTPGRIIIKGRCILVGGTDVSGDHSSSGTIPGPVPGVDWSILGNLDELRGRERLEPGRRQQPGRIGEGALDATILEPEVEPGSRPAGELIFELFYGDQVAQRKEGQPIDHDYPSSAASWSLRITRKPDTSTDRRRYGIVAKYPSVLPLLDRRIPMSSMRYGFDQNWNDGHQYLEELWIENNIINWRLDEHLSSLYDLPREGNHDLGERDSFTIPLVLKKSIQFGVGYEDGSGPSAPKIPYFSLTIHLYCKDSRIIDVWGPDNVTLPQDFSIEVRLLLGSTQGIMIYDPRIVLSHEIEDSIMGFDVDMPERLTRLERALFAMQWGEAYNRFDQVIRPWLVGHYEVVAIEYDQATDDIVVWHVGRPVELELEIVTAPAAVSGGGWTDLPHLFAGAEDEKWVSSPVPGFSPRPPRSTPGALEKVDHIVVLMQENRSFDQVLGYLSRDAGHEGVEGLLPGDNARDVNEYRRENENAPRQYRSTLSPDTSWPFALNNPCHSHDCVVGQISGGMTSFVADYARRLGPNAPVKDLQRIMNYHGAQELPVFAELVRQFAICDHWFASHIGGTLPNRHVTFTGDLNRDRHGLPEEDNSDFEGYAPTERLTFFDHLTSRGVSWKLFEHGYSMLRLYRKYTFDLTNIVGFNDEVLGFEKLARDGALPSVSFIEPDYIELPEGNDDHAPADMHNGQILVARILRAMMRSPIRADGSSQWAKSMLIITYDEHGGFYDHLVPPNEVDVTSDDGTVTTRQIPPLSNATRQLGPRVPAIVVSPLIDADPSGVNVSKLVYEHTTIPATILRRFCSPRPPEMSARVTAANDLRGLLTRDSPRPDADFVETLRVMDAVADSPVRQSPGATHSPVPTRKLDRSADPDDFKQDFHGFIAYASAVTGRPTNGEYFVGQAGQLLFYRDATQNGTGDVSSPSVIGLGGWQDFRFLFSGGNGIIYAVDQEGRLVFYRDQTQDGTGDVASPSVIGLGGWQDFRFLFSGGNGIIYAVVAATLPIFDSFLGGRR
jgi:phospholipase C